MIDQSSHLLLLEQTQLYKEALPSSREFLVKESMIRQVSKNEYLFTFRNRVNYVYMILDGFAVLERESADHGLKSVLLLSAGNLVNEVILDAQTSSVNCRAIGNAVVLAIPKDKLLILIERDFAVSRIIINSMANKIRRLYRLIEGSTNTTQLNHRIASRIWKFARDYGVQHDDYVEIPFEVRITFLASFVGSNRESVSKIIKDMTGRNILSIDKGTCRIYNMEELLLYKSQKPSKT